MQCYQVGDQQNRQQQGINNPNFVLTPAPHGGLVAQPNKNNIGTNYQLPNLGGGEDTILQTSQLSTQSNQQQFFTNGTSRPLSTKLGFNQIQANQPVKLQQNLQMQHQQLPIQNLQLVDHHQSQYNQLQHLQQMQEIHQTKKQKQRIQYQNRSQAPPGGILSSKNLHVSSKNIINNSSQGTLTQEQVSNHNQYRAKKLNHMRNQMHTDQSPYFRQHQNPQNDSRTQVALQQQIVDVTNQYHQNQIHNTEQKQHQDSFIENQSPLKNDQRNKDSRNSKRSVVFSKNKHVGNFQMQQMSDKPAPSTPKVSIGTKTREPSTGQMIQSVQGQGILANQPAMMNSTNTQIRVNAPNTVKINKNTIKNLVIQKANQQQQLQHLQEMQMHLNNEEKQAAGYYGGNNQIGSHLNNMNNQQNIKTLINQKRRSNAVDQMRDNNGITLTQKGLSSSSALNNHSRIGKKMYPSNMNVSKPNESGQMMNSNQQQLFNKTMSNMTTQNSSNNGGQSINGVAVNPTQNNNPYSKSFSKQAQNQADNLINSLMVVKINSVQASQDGIAPNQTQIQTVNFKNLTTEQQLQVIQHHQQYMQQQLLEKQLQQNNSNQTQGANLQQQPATELTSNSSIKDQLTTKGQMVRPQSQNNKLMQHNSVNTSQNNMSQQLNELQQQSTQATHSKQTRSNTLQMASMQNGIKQTSGSDLMKQNTQNLGVSKQITLALANQSNTLGIPGQQIQSPSSQQVANQAGQKLISSKHLQIQQIRMINNSSVDNYNNNSDNDSSHRYGQMAQTQYYSATSSQQAQNQLGTSEAVLMKKIGSPGNSKYFIKNQLRHISKLNDDQEGLNSINQGLQGNDIEEDQEQIPSNVLYNDADSNSQGNLPHFNNALHFKEGGITLEDDVESMLSEQFNASNESMFRVRGIANTNIGGGLNAGDSTFRCNDSMYDEDRGLISESEDGWYAEKDQGDRMGDANKMDDISEHSSDYVTDSEPEENQDGQIVPKKVKKKGEKGEKKKKKKKKVDAENPDGGDNKQGGDNKTMTEPKKMVMDYKKLEQDTKEVKQHKDQPKKGSKVEATNQKNQKTGKEKDNKKVTAQQIKINIQTKKAEKQTVSNNQNDIKNNFSSPLPKSQKQEQINKNNQKNLQTDQKKGGNQNENKGKEEAKKEDNKFNNSVAHTPLKKAKKNGLKLQALNNALPKNLQECYDRFFESDFKINPQFEYENATLAQKFLEQFDEPDGKYLDIATRILDSFLKEYGSESNYLDAEGRKLDQDETHAAITNYLNNLGVGEWISINFQKNQVAPTSVTHDPKTGKCKMNIKLPCEYREGRMMGVLDHEIGTHFLRKHNEKQQQWYKKREKFDMKTCIATEEGLACTNQMVQTVKDGKCRPFLYRSALNYYAAYMAKEMSFVDLFRNLEKYVDSPQARWKFTLRVKRGLTDTSTKGGLYKDQVYLEGAINILSHRHILNFKALLCGKLSLADYKRQDIYSILNYGDQLLPPFMEDMDEYMRCLNEIAITNHIEDADDDDEYDMEPDAPQEAVPPDNKEDDEPAGDNAEENPNNQHPVPQIQIQDTEVNNNFDQNNNIGDGLIQQQESSQQHDSAAQMSDTTQPIQAQLMNTNIDFIIQSSLPEGFGGGSMQNNIQQNNDDALETNNQQNINETQN